MKQDVNQKKLANFAFQKIGRLMQEFDFREFCKVGYS